MAADWERYLDRWIKAGLIASSTTDRIRGYETDRDRARGASYNSSRLHVRYMKSADKIVPVLDEPVAFFIPEHVPDPSRTLMGQPLWVEATIPKQGIPRPIALGLSQDNAPSRLWA